ncbi:MAG TPA: cobaltochelatase subunit CobT, partial [Xanthobacteraceae bacterium]|nr:cobaltochelatase subunit CobT [Xanthobacteraceae bacterium]
MASNFKGKSTSREAPTEPFKRSVAACLKAIARKPELEVGYAAERPGFAGGKARLPEPPRKLNPVEAAIVRGHADSIALKLACHDPGVHRRLVPGNQQGRAVFDAVEQARVEAIGARRMEGVARNLSAMLEDRFHRGKFDDVTDQADAPIEDAVALMVRERLTGLTPPPAARKLVELWRPWIEDRAGRDLDRLGKLVENQRRFGDAIRDLLDSLEMGDERNRDSEDGEDDREEEANPDEAGEQGDAKDSDDAQGMSLEEAEISADELPEGATEAVDAPTAEMPDDADMGEAETAN